MSELKLCKDCKHFQPAIGYVGGIIEEWCAHINPETLGEPEPVYGNRESSDPINPSSKRTAGSCGMAAIFWEPIPEPPKPKPWWRLW